MEVKSLSTADIAAVAAVNRNKSGSKSRAARKTLSYNPKDISAQLMRVKKPIGASQVLSRARARVAMLKRAQATGEYDSVEIENALVHAKRMVSCASLKVSNLREEERLHRKAEDRKELRLKQIRAAKRLERLKKRSHRQDENKQIFDADMKYYQNASGSRSMGMAGSSFEAGAAVALEISSAAENMNNIKLAEAALSQQTTTGNPAEGNVINILV